MGNESGQSLLAIYRGDTDRFCRMMEFYFEPLFYIHGSYLESLLGGSMTMIPELYKSRRAWNAANRMLCKQFRMSETEIFFPQEERHQLLFLSGSMVFELVLAIGATLFHREIHRIVLKHPREAIIKLLGPKLYHHALRRAMFFQPRFLPFDLTGVVGVNLGDRIVNAGKFCVLACLSDLPEPLQRRFKLKFPIDDEWLFPTYSESLRVNDLWKFVKRLLDDLQGKKGGKHVAT